VPLEVIAGEQSAKISLGRCGAAPAAAVDELSLLSRAPAPPRRLDDRLVDRLRRVVDHFSKDGQTMRVDLVSGFRPRGSGSFHSSGRALDFRIEGVKNDALVAFCKTLPDTGCGYYPNDIFIHMDVRDEGTGHVAWVDSSAPSDVHRDATRTAPEPAPAPAPAPVAPALALAVPVAAAPGPLPALPAAEPSPAHPEPADKAPHARHGRKGHARHHHERTI